MNRDLAVRITFFLLRIVSGWLFFQAGTIKLMGWFGGIPGGGTVPVTSQAGIAGLLETVGGIAIMLGLFTRPVAFIVSGEMAVAYWQFHAPNGTWPAQNQGVPAVLFCFIFLFMAAYGGGDWSLDALIRRKRAGSIAKP
jgi:putative oxidoreductase